MRAALNLNDVLLPGWLVGFGVGMGGACPGRECEFIRATHECEKVMVYQNHIIGNHFLTQVRAARVVTA